MNRQDDVYDLHHGGRDARYEIRMKKSEKKAWKAKAKKEGLKLSVWMRKKLNGSS